MIFHDRYRWKHSRMSHYLVRDSALEGYRETVTQLGGNPEAILAAVGMAGMHADPDSRVAYTA